MEMKVAGHGLFRHYVHPFRDGDMIPYDTEHALVFREVHSIADIKVQYAQIVRLTHNHFFQPGHFEWKRSFTIM